MVSLTPARADDANFSRERRREEQSGESAKRCRKPVGTSPDSSANSFVRAFQQALRAAGKLPSNVQKVFLARLDRVRRISRQLGNGVGESMDILLSEFDLSVQARAHSRKR